MNHYFLRTDRLILRKLREEDFPDYAVYAVDDEMSRMMGRALLKTEADIRQNFNWLKDHEPRCYGLVEQNSHCLIGNLSICSRSPCRSSLAAGKEWADAFLLYLPSLKLQEQLGFRFLSSLSVPTPEGTVKTIENILWNPNRPRCGMR